MVGQNKQILYRWAKKKLLYVVMNYKLNTAREPRKVFYDIDIF